ncbi:hypothetical protein DPD40_20770, partial [Salmonella enterica subsp. enterica serovar Typhimurium]|nr:hypothetical protein [Salmonella enterica subsp. enterica serovar Kisangani]EAN0276594.1 hypothetical protein [Salmonella enterica]EBW3288958.1 hypothetical protein [Salmonella enterica subsp. enterica serovar Typhimurium]ECA9380527.1 hypothetical protein [Salmonella enterica subsp. enterica serovar Montevideo]EAS7891386.1 hypothetical protein [Salmonella enterica]
KKKGRIAAYLLYRTSSSGFNRKLLISLLLVITTYYNIQQKGLRKKPFIFNIISIPITNPLACLRF